MDAKGMGRVIKKGFTLIELLIVFIIVGLLASIAIPIYRANIKKVASSEGVALLGTILTAQKAYFAEHGRYTTEEEAIGIEMAGNKYFRDFVLVQGDEHGFKAITSGTGLCEGIQVIMEFTNTAGATISYTGL